ncbi:hypothetical protein J2W51_005892 [Tardiphaga robiniae]|jgi:hypothetical protein|nr:hypothetical protein [Tardiphaga robiniae]
MTGPLERIIDKQLPSRLAARKATAATLAKAVALGTTIRDRNAT